MLQTFKYKKPLDSHRVHTLLYLINEQDGINEYSGKFFMINNRAGWNKRAEGANFEALINEQGENIRNMMGTFVKRIKNQRFTRCKDKGSSI